MKSWIAALAGFVFLLLLVLDPVWGQNQPLVIEGGTLIDGTGRDPIQNSVIVIEGSRIKAVGTKGNVAYPAGARVIRAEGKTVLPGLIDAHVHLLDFMLPLFLHYGVTTIFDTANPTEWILAQREALQRGKMKGPRLFVTGAIIDGPPERSNPVTFAARAAYRIHTRNAEEARMATRNLIDQGVDGIKVYEGLSTASLKAVVEEAHQAGLEVVGHAVDAREATLVGMKFLEHVRPIVHSTLGDPAKVQAVEEGRLPNSPAEMDTALFGPLIDLLVQNGVYFNPTLTRPRPESREWYGVVVKLLEDPSAQFITAARRESWLGAVKAADTGENMPQSTESLQKTREFIRRFVQAGGKVVTGPDTGPRSSPTNIAGLAMHVEMEALVNAGLTPMQAILASTKWSAELLRKEKDLGTVEPGKLADLILIEGDPLADIRVTQNIRTVILDGKIADTRLDPNFRNLLPRTFYVDSPLEYVGPEISRMTPGIARAGDAEVTIQVSGKRFNPRSFLRFDTDDLPTTFLSNSLLTATVDGALLQNVGTYAVTVVNPGSGGSPSNVAYFIVNFPPE
ncbi:MAG: amidohydrolase family protein [Acidobacteria bacterium]|nr:amidohydrolase family protein [Acidobacteriota bacterium]